METELSETVSILLTTECWAFNYMHIQSDFRVTVSDQVLCQKVGGETVLLDLASEQYFGLDDVGTRFWELLGNSNTFNEIVGRIADEYEAPHAQIEIDLKELLLRLSAEGLVSMSPIEL